MKNVLILAILALALSGRLPVYDSAIFAQTSPVRAGISAVDVTPRKLPIRVAGSIGERTEDEITDRLHARTLVLENKTTALSITLVDSCLMPRDLLDAAKAGAAQKTEIPTAHMLIAATHTHSAPPVMGVHGNDAEPEYRRFLKARIRESIVQAYNNRVEAQIGSGVAECYDYVFCRRWLMKPGTAFTVPFTGRDGNRVQMNPGRGSSDKIAPVGPVDPAVTVLSVQTRTGRPLALLANYSTHYAGAPGISADYFGIFARKVKERLAPKSEAGFLGIMSNGTSGDANCIDFSASGQDFDRFEVAEAVANAALSAYKDIEYADELDLEVAQTAVNIDVRMPSSEEVKAAQDFVETQPADKPVQTWKENYARETLLLSQMPPTRELKLQTIRVGRLGITAIPCEVFGSTGLALKARSPFPLTMNISMANGAAGYLPSPDQFALGGYTTWRARTSCLAMDAEPKVQETVTQLLKKVSN